MRCDARGVSRVARRKRLFRLSCVYGLARACRSRPWGPPPPPARDLDPTPAPPSDPNPANLFRAGEPVTGLVLYPARSGTLARLREDREMSLRRLRVPRGKRRGAHARALQLIRESVHLQNRGESPFTPDSRLPQTVRRGRPRGALVRHRRVQRRGRRNHTHPIDPHPRNPAQPPALAPGVHVSRVRRREPAGLVQRVLSARPSRRRCGATRGAEGCVGRPRAYGWYWSLAAGPRMWSTNSSTRTGHAAARVVGVESAALAIDGDGEVEHLAPSVLGDAAMGVEGGDEVAPLAEKGEPAAAEDESPGVQRGGAGEVARFVPRDEEDEVVKAENLEPSASSSARSDAKSAAREGKAPGPMSPAACACASREVICGLRTSGASSR